jgi:hypothetical protein
MNENEKYPPNSDVSRNTPARVSGDIRPSLWSMITRNVIAIEDPRTIIPEIVIPTMKDALFNICESIIYPNGAPGHSSWPRQRTPYNRPNEINRSQRSSVRQRDEDEQDFEDYRDVCIDPMPGDTPADVSRRAREFIDDLIDIAATNESGTLSMMEMFDRLGKTRKNEQENYWGWHVNDLSYARPRAIHGGSYRIIFPKPRSIK